MCRYAFWFELSQELSSPALEVTVMHLRRLWLHDFRSYEELDLDLAPGLTVVVGDNGTGKTNLLEAAGFLSTLASFRGTPTEAMIRNGAERANIRGEVLVGEREVLLETEFSRVARTRVLVNKQALPKTTALREVLRISVFSPDDLVLIKGGPSERRNYLDDVLASLHPRNAAALSDLDKILRQRNALLKQAGGRLSAEIGFTLDVWDDKLASVGTMVGNLRSSLLETIGSMISAAYVDIADRPAQIGAVYETSWMIAGLAEALAQGRSDDVRRGLSLVGPHRDDVGLTIEGRPSRTQASQGEQRTLALALRLAAHRHIAVSTGSPPLLLLDDVFSELDPVRSDALVRHLPPGQSLLATAGLIPNAAQVEARISVCRPGLLSAVLPQERLHASGWHPSGLSSSLSGIHSGLTVDNAGEIVDDQL
jgi:DNA replication and repair protein RecF